MKISFFSVWFRFESYYKSFTERISGIYFRRVSIEWLSSGYMKESWFVWAKLYTWLGPLALAHAYTGWILNCAHIEMGTSCTRHGHILYTHTTLYRGSKSKNLLQIHYSREYNVIPKPKHTLSAEMFMFTKTIKVAVERSESKQSEAYRTVCYSKTWLGWNTGYCVQ